MTSDEEIRKLKSRIVELEKVQRATDRMLNAFTGPIRALHANVFCAAYNDRTDDELRQMVENQPRSSNDWRENSFYQQMILEGQKATKVRENKIRKLRFSNNYAASKTLQLLFRESASFRNMMNGA